jgi:uncharacterized protein YcnI
MRCSGWSSLAISACSVVALALVVSAPAGAHVTAPRPFLSVSATDELDLLVPNERKAPMTGFVVVVPADFRIVSAASTDGWNAGADGKIASWHNGSLAPGAETMFAIELEAPPQPGPATLRTQQHYPDGGVVRWDVALTVTPAPEAAPSQNLGWAVITALLGLLALTVIGVLLWRRRTAALQER